MKNISLTLPSLFLSILLLSACSSTPTSLQLTPKLNDSNLITQAQTPHSWALDSQDLRTARYLISISSGDDVATLINESSSTREVIEKTLQAHWIKQGHTFAQDSGENKIDIQVIKLLAEVEQGTLTHETTINVVLKVELNTAKKTFSKVFRSNLKEEAAFGAKIDVVSQQLNTQLSQLLDQIVQDSELNAKLLQL